MKHTVTEPCAPGNTVPAQGADWVLATKYKEMTGITPMTVHNRRRAGIWLDGTHCGVVGRHLYVNVKEADQWIKNQLHQLRQA